MKGDIMATFDYTDTDANTTVRNIVTTNNMVIVDNSPLFTKVKFGSRTFVKINMDMFRELKAKRILYFRNYGLSSEPLEEATEFYIDIAFISSITKSPGLIDKNKFYHTVSFNIGCEQTAYIIFYDDTIFESFIQLI
jgi:hypothetical protein